jgi:hypothetical protein
MNHAHYGNPQELHRPILIDLKAMLTFTFTFTSQVRTDEIVKLLPTLRVRTDEIVKLLLTLQDRTDEIIKSLLTLQVRTDAVTMVTNSVM